MKIVLDCHYAPCIAWWALAAQASDVEIEKHSFFRKGSYRNRCHVYGANGLLRLSLPMQKGKGKRSTIKEVNISYDHDWRKLHWESLCSAYRSSPFFEFYEIEFQAIYELEIHSLFDFNMYFINQVKSLLGIKKDWHFSTTYEMQLENDRLDFREIIHPNTDKYPLESWIDFPNYMQVFVEKHGFIENLSILDLLFNLGPAALDYLQNQVKLNLVS